MSLDTLEIFLVIAGGLAMYGGDHLANLALYNAGIFTVGAGFALDGAVTMVTQSPGFWNKLIWDEAYRGLAAILHGLVFTVLGGGVMIYGLARFLNVGDAAVNLVSGRPGIIFLATSLVLLSLGSAQILSAAQWTGSLGDWLLGVPRGLAGLFLAAFGLVALGIGLFELFDPTAFNDFVNSIVGSLSP